MADVTLTIGDRRHVVACRNGEEDQLRHIGQLLDQRWASANRAAGGAGGERAMLLVALMLADSLDEAEKRPVPPPPPPPPAPVAAETLDTAVLEKLADRLEALADSLEK